MPSVIDLVVGMNHQAVDAGVDHIREQVTELKTNFSNSFAEFASVGFLGEMAAKTLEYGHQVKSLSEQLGVNSEWLQRVGNVAKLYGADLETAGQSLNKLIINQQKAIEGGKAQAEAFERFGISTKELTRLQPDELFNRIADATKNAKDRGEAYADVVTVMGRSAGKLFATLEQGSAKIKEQGDAMGVLSSSTIDSLEDADRHIKIFEQNVTVVFGSLINWASRAISLVALQFTEVIGGSAIIFEKLRGNAKEAAQLAENLQKVTEDRMKFITMGVDPNSPKDIKGAIDPDREADDTAEKKKQTQEAAKILKIQEAILKMSEAGAEHAEKARLDAMSTEEKIAYLKEKALGVQYAIDANSDSGGKIKDQTLLFKIQEELAQAQKSEDTRKAEAAKALAREEESYVEHQTERAKRADDDAFEHRFRAIRNEGDQRAALIERQKQLEGQLANIPTPLVKSMESKLDEIQAVKDRIFDIDSKSAPGVKADSLARIGGGGNVSQISTMERQLAEQKETNRTLKSIDSKLGNSTQNLSY